jgi:hypothetical protein
MYTFQHELCPFYYEKISYIIEIYWNLWNSYWKCLIWIKEWINYVWEAAYPIIGQVKLVFSIKKKKSFFNDTYNHYIYTVTYSVKSSKHNISTLCEVKTHIYNYKKTVYPLSIFSNIKFEHRISLNYNLKKCHDLGE